MRLHPPSSPRRARPRAAPRARPRPPLRHLPAPRRGVLRARASQPLPRPGRAPGAGASRHRAAGAVARVGASAGDLGAGKPDVDRAGVWLEPRPGRSETLFAAGYRYAFPLAVRGTPVGLAAARPPRSTTRRSPATTWSWSADFSTRRRWRSRTRSSSTSCTGSSTRPPRLQQLQRGHHRVLAGRHRGAVAGPPHRFGQPRLRGSRRPRAAAGHRRAARRTCYRSSRCRSPAPA